ncbi:hypothetical protein QTN25_007083 [Entamoeba marina]
MLFFITSAQWSTPSAWTESIVSNVTTIGCLNSGRTDSKTDSTRFLFNSYFNAAKLVLYSSGDTVETYINQTIIFQETPPNLNIIQYKNSFEYKHSFIFTENMPNNVLFLFGCFDEESGCSQIQKPWNVIYVSQIKDFTVKGGSTDQRILIHYDAIDDPFNYPYIYIDELSQ